MGRDLQVSQYLSTRVCLRQLRIVVEVERLQTPADVIVSIDMHKLTKLVSYSQVPPSLHEFIQWELKSNGCRLSARGGVPELY